MTKLIPPLAALLALAGGARAEEPAAETIEATPAMWRAADADTELYLFGTFHILPPNVAWRTETFEAAFDKADRAYFEVETDAPDAQSKAIGVIMTQGFNPDGGMLTDMLNDEDGAKLREIVQSVGLPFDGVNPMRPWNAFLTISVQFIVKQGFDPSAGVESVLLAEARTKGKSLRFFETMEQQLALFTSLPPETEKSLLELTIRDWDEQVESFDALFAAWRNGDAEYIDKEMNATMAEDAPTVFKRLIDDRNAAWASELTRVMEEETGTVFVAVGAAHLVGEQSVPALLAAEGYEVERVPPSLDALEEEAAMAEAPKEGVSLEDALEAANDNAPPEEDAIGDLLKEAAEN